MVKKIKSHKNHDMATHTAKCDVKDCGFISMVHAHDDHWAVEGLSIDLANHNRKDHGMNTDSEDIKDAVKKKMKRVNPH